MSLVTGKSLGLRSERRDKEQKEASGKFEELVSLRSENAKLVSRIEAQHAELLALENKSKKLQTELDQTRQHYGTVAAAQKLHAEAEAEVASLTEKCKQLAGQVVARDEQIERHQIAVDELQKLRGQVDLLKSLLESGPSAGVD